jgi:hypothetical protein
MQELKSAETFIDSCVSEKAKPEDIEGWIDYWHDSTENLGELHEYLGMTWHEYSLWVHSPGIIYIYIKSREKNEETQQEKTN